MSRFRVIFIPEVRVNCTGVEALVSARRALGQAINSDNLVCVATDMVVVLMIDDEKVLENEGLRRVFREQWSVEVQVGEVPWRCCLQADVRRLEGGRAEVEYVVDDGALYLAWEAAGFPKRLECEQDECLLGRSACMVRVK